MIQKESPADASTRRRTKGRPPLNAAETERIRSHIKAAATTVFAEHGSRGMSVELITLAGNISRPTFYRYFKNTDEVLDMILREANDLLIEMVVVAIREADGPVQKLELGLLAWKIWGEQHAPMLRAIYAEIHDERTLAATHRKRVLRAIESELSQLALTLGRAPFDPLQLETFVIGVEYLGYRFHFGAEPKSDALWQRTRQAMIRLALGLLGGPFEWAHATQLAQILDVNLN